jgi:hypothetical protein
MAGPTDLLNEDVKELRESHRQFAGEIKGVFERLSAEMRDSNQRLTDAIGGLSRDFSNFRVEVTRELGTINVNLEKNRVETAKELGTINTNLESFKGRIETSLKVATWTLGVAVPILLGLVYWSYTATERAVRIEDSILALRDHAKAQDSRIDKLLDFRGTIEKEHRPQSPVFTVPPPDPQLKQSKAAGNGE